MNTHYSAALGGAKSVPQTLTELGIKAAHPPAQGTFTIWDGSLKNFGIRISQGGTKSFVLLIGSGRRQTIGRYPTITLAQARDKAKTMLAERTLGRHQPRSITWDAARDQYLALCQRKNRPGVYGEY